MGRSFDSLKDIIAAAQGLAGGKLSLFAQGHQLSPRVYARYLSMQFHLTRGVQRYFLTAAAHEDLARRKPLRSFLCEFASEEELHFTLAENDARALGEPLEPMPFDVELWHAYFNQVTTQHPFVRLGAACVLENLSSGAVREPLHRLLAAPFLNRQNTHFIVLHQHELIPHGDQILEALMSAELEDQHILDLEEGARKGALFFLRFIDWTLELNEDEQALFGDVPSSSRMAA